MRTIHRYVGPSLTLILPLIHANASPPRYDIARVGLYDALHTGSAGYQSSEALFLRPNGLVAGESLQFQQTTVLGTSVWVYANGATTRLGLLEGVGAQHSFVLGLNDRGDVLGQSASYFGSGRDTYKAWLYRNGETRRIGVLEGLPIRDIRASAMNASGQAVGTTSQTVAMDVAGTRAWMYDADTDTTRVIGLTDSEHRNPIWQLPYAEVVSVSDSGAAIGNTRRYLPNGADGGNSAWIYENGVNRRIGYFDAQHTNTEGRQQSGVLAINARGEAIGNSKRWAGSADLGLDSWLYTGGQHVRLGLFDSEHMTGGQRWESRVDLLNDNGQTAGYSQRYGNGGGYTAWQFSNGVATPIGLYDAEHSNSSGRRVSYPEQMNLAGDVIGMSWRYIGTADRGQSAWLYSHQTTTRLGYHDEAYTAPNGSKFTKAVDLNEAGDVTGYSRYYDGTAYLGQTGWFFDNATDTQLPLVFSTRDDGLRFTDPKTVLDSGIVLGTFTLFEGMVDSGSHVFWWSQDEGFYDLGTLVRGLDDAGWQWLIDVYGSSVPGSIDGEYIVGHGRFNGQSNDGSVYLLTRQIPAPPSLTAACILIGLTRTRRR